MRLAILMAGLAAPALAAGVGIDEAEALMEQARACAHSGDRLCVFEKMDTVLRSDEAIAALSAQPAAVTQYWMYYYRTALDVVGGTADPAERINRATMAIDLLKTRFPGQDDAAMMFHLIKAEAHAALGDLKGGADDARRALATIPTLATMADDARSLVNAAEAKARLAALETLYKGVL